MGKLWGSTKWENRGSKTFCAPTQDRVKLFVPPPPFIKEWKLVVPPFNMATTLSYRVNLPQNCLYPQHSLNPFRSPFHRGKISHAPPLPIISDQSLNSNKENATFIQKTRIPRCSFISLFFCYSIWSGLGVQEILLLYSSFLW